MGRLNLDQIAAQYAQKVVKTGTEAVKNAKPVENLVTKTLGVLQEQGVYACILFLFSRTSDEKKIAEAIRPLFYELLEKIPSFTDKNLPVKGVKPEQVLDFYANTICDDIDTLFLIKDLYEQMLIYARYGAKAADKGA